MTKRKLSTVLEEARTIIQVWEQQPEVVSQLAQVGYTPNSFAQLRDLYKNACDTKLQHSNAVITLREITASIGDGSHGQGTWASDCAAPQSSLTIGVFEDPDAEC